MLTFGYQRHWSCSLAEVSLEDPAWFWSCRQTLYWALSWSLSMSLLVLFFPALIPCRVVPSQPSSRLPVITEPCRELIWPLSYWLCVDEQRVVGWDCLLRTGEDCEDCPCSRNHLKVNVIVKENFSEIQVKLKAEGTSAFGSGEWYCNNPYSPNEQK